MPFGSESRFGTCASKTRAVAGMFHATQWTQVPMGASGSSAISAKLFAPLGTSDQLKGGDTSCPSQVYDLGIIPPASNAKLFSSIDQPPLPLSVTPPHETVPLDDEPANRPEPTRKPFGVPVVVDRPRGYLDCLRKSTEGAAFQRAAFIPVDSLRGSHPIGVPSWMGFPTRFEHLVSSGFDTSDLVFLGSD